MVVRRGDPDDRAGPCSWLDRQAIAEAICDDCVAERLQLNVRQHANHKMRELAGSDGYERSKVCSSLCGADKLVIRRR